MKKLLLTAIIGTTVLIAATIKTSYRATNQSITVTHLNSLVNSTSQTTGIWSSAYVDNATTLDVDEQVYVQITTATSAVSSSGTYSVYAYGCIGGTTTCTDGVSGIEGTISLTNPTNLIKLGSCNAVAISTAYTCGPFSIAGAFGGTMPARWGIVVQNLTGASLSATGNAVTYDAVQMTSN